MNPLRLAVVGCGHLGRVHARLLSQLPDAQLVAVVDPSPAARLALADTFQVDAWPHHQLLPGRVDAAVVAAPTSLHAEIGLDLMRHGIHVLMEKPLASTTQDVQRLMLAAARHAVVLAVGHVEQFNPAFTALRQQVRAPRYITAVRSGGFTFRSTDVGVVLDLMIHDLDLVLSLVPGPVVRVDAFGLPVVSDREDVAEARIEFANGCLATLKASRACLQAERSLAVYEPDQHLFADLTQRSALVVRRGEALRGGTFRLSDCSADQIAALKERVFEELLPVSKLEVPQCNPLEDELTDFVRSIRQRRRPRVTAEHAYRAVRLAEQILSRIADRGTLPKRDGVEQHRRAA